MGRESDSEVEPERVAVRVAAFLACKGARGAVLAAAVAFASAGAGSQPLHSQQAGTLIRVDSIGTIGNVRVPYDALLALLPFAPGDNITGLRDLQTAIKDLMALGQFRDVQVYALGGPDEGTTIVFRVEEQLLVRRVVVRGLEHADADEVRDSVGLQDGEPFSDFEVKRTKELIRSQLAEEGIPFATIIADELDKELSIYRPSVSDEKQGTFSSNYATLTGKKVVIVDDVISTGTVLKQAISDLSSQQAEPQLACLTQPSHTVPRRAPPCQAGPCRVCHV